MMKVEQSKRQIKKVLNNFKSTKHGDIFIRQVGLEEKDILQQIFNLRITCRLDNQYISFKKFPNGWSDEIDFISYHYAAFCKNELIGSGRITLFESIILHPYFPAIENILPSDLLTVPIAYLSRDQVAKNFRGEGIRKLLLMEREKLCRDKSITNLFIDVAANGRQYSNFSQDGYTDIGSFETNKIHWDLGPGILMHKILC